MTAVAELPDKVGDLEKQLKERVEPNDGFFAADIHREIDDTKDLINSGRNEEAKKRFGDTEAKVLKAEASHNAEPLAWNLLWVELGYLALILLLGYLTFKLPDFWLWKGLVTLSAKTVWFGALGGVTVALYGIYSHVQVRDFDAKYRLWYVCKPIVGAIFGWFVYLVYYVGLVSVQGSSSVNVQTPAVPYAIAFLAGFSERFTVQIIDKLMQVLATWEEKPTTTTPRMF
jgi:hypothetical protein